MALPFPPGLKEKLLMRFEEELERVSTPTYAHPFHELRIEENGMDFDVVVALDPFRLFGYVLTLHQRCNPYELTAEDSQTGESFVAYGDDVKRLMSKCYARDYARRHERLDRSSQAAENLEKLLS